VSACYALPLHAADGKVVFYLDKQYRPVVRLDRIQNLSDGVKAVLAIYALENGAGCEGKNEQGLVRCALTSALGLGGNCSEEHIRFVRSWFSKAPNLTTRWSAGNEDAQKAGTLERLCYGQPDTASWQNIWEIIRVSEVPNGVVVDAIFFGGSQHGRTRTRYNNTYRIEGHSVTEIASKATTLERSFKSIFEK
jgi:hypothetical protein